MVGESAVDNYVLIFFSIFYGWKICLYYNLIKGMMELVDMVDLGSIA